MKNKNAKRIRFTRDELEIISDMAAIASAAAWGEGDYQNWDEARSKPYASLREKVWKLISRAECAEALDKAIDRAGGRS